jgi:hypothetical protein
MSRLLVLGLSVLGLLVLAGCDEGVTSLSVANRLMTSQPELANCKAFSINESSGAKLVVVRCPNSTTTTQMDNKEHTRTVMVD